MSTTSVCTRPIDNQWVAKRPPHGGVQSADSLVIGQRFDYHYCVPGRGTGRHQHRCTPVVLASKSTGTLVLQGKSESFQVSPEAAGVTSRFDGYWEHYAHLVPRR